MWKGELEAIYISSKKGDEMQALQQVRAVPGKGLMGDRYYQRAELQPSAHSPENEVTLIEVETYDALQRDYSLSLDPGTSRRNLVTRGAPLNHLVGREFKVGEIKLLGLELCEPCTHLAKLSGRREILPALVHRGGLRAQILTGGIIEIGDEIREINPSPTD